jgi:isopropylmalate/homocitrate/citramalate synthase
MRLCVGLLYLTPVNRASRLSVKERWISDQWYLSRFNFVSKVQKQMKLPEKIAIADCTLRDGEQQAGVVFTKEEKVQIARKLDEVGIHEIEAGMPASSREDEEAVRAIVKENLGAKVYAFARATKQDVDKVIDCGASGVQISLPIGYLQLQHKLKWDEEKLIRTALEITDYAKSHGLWVNLSPYDTTRAEPNFMRRYLSAIEKEGHVDRVRLVDTVGAASPWAIRYLVMQMKKILKRIPIEVHVHNDLGLATANTLAGLEAGAQVASTTTNGIGERVGNAATEEVLMALLLLYGVDLRIKYEKLVELSKLVEELSGVRLQVNKPIVGRGIFSHESGGTVAGILEMPFAGELYAPELVGQTRKIVLGKKSGRASIEFRLKELGLSVPDQHIATILARVKEEAIKNKRPISDEEFRAIVTEARIVP